MRKASSARARLLSCDKGEVDSDTARSEQERFGRFAGRQADDENQENPGNA
jgi:hypothetical protein